VLGMSGNILAPEELLEKLYILLKRREYDEAIEVFRQNAPTNHVLTFIRTIPFKYVVKTENYVVIIKHSTFGLNADVFVIGLDDNYRFFCHNTGLVPRDVAYNIRCDDDVKNIMGFTKHVWEAKQLCEGDVVRLQGDVTIRILRVFNDTTELYNFLLADVLCEIIHRSMQGHLETILNDEAELDAFFEYIDQLIKQNKYGKARGYMKAIAIFWAIHILRLNELGSFLNMAKEYMEELREMFDEAEIELVFKLAVEPWIIQKLKYNEVLDLLSNFLLGLARIIAQKIPLYERRLRYTLGNHTVMIIGVTDIRWLDWNMNRPINIIMPHTLVFRRDTIITLRPQVITALHDEHKKSSLMIPLGIIQVDTLPTGPMQVTRETIPAQADLVVDQLKSMIAISSDPMLKYLIAKRRRKMRNK